MRDKRDIYIYIYIYIDDISFISFISRSSRMDVYILARLSRDAPKYIEETRPNIYIYIYI